MGKLHSAGKVLERLFEATEDLVTADYDKLAGITASAAEINLLAGAEQATEVSDIAITYTANDPSITPNGAVTVADGSSPTVAELLELAEEIIANQNAIIDALQGAGFMAAS